MDTKIIQRRVDAMCSALIAKGKREPMVQAEIESGAQPSIYYRWTKTGSRNSYDWDSRHVRADTMEEALRAAEKEIEALPDAKAERQQEFMEAVANAIDIGRKNGIDAEWVNPLSVLMQDLSKNALTFQAVA